MPSVSDTALHCKTHTSKVPNERINYAFWRGFNERPSIVPCCPGTSFQKGVVQDALSVWESVSLQNTHQQLCNEVSCSSFAEASGQSGVLPTNNTVDNFHAQPINVQR